MDHKASGPYCGVWNSEQLQGSGGGITTLATSVSEESGGQIFGTNNSNNNAFNALTG